MYFVALATTTPKLLKTAGLYRRCLVHSPNFLSMQYLGESDLPSLALKASRYGLCVSFEASVCRRLFQISSWAPSLNWASVVRSNQRDGDWSAEITRTLAIPSASISTKSKQNILKTSGKKLLLYTNSSIELANHTF